MGQVNVNKEVQDFELPGNQELAVERIEGSNTARVILNRRFVGYIDWQLREEFIAKLRETWANYLLDV